MITFRQLVIVFSMVSAGYAKAQVTITIDKTKQYQTIEGFGGLAQEAYDWGPSNVMSDAFANDMVNDLGCTIFRHIIDGGLEPQNDNNDPQNTDLTKFNMGSEEGCKSNAHGALTPSITTLKKLRSLVEKNGEKCQIYTSVFSPPHWMKYINCVWGTDIIWNRLVNQDDEVEKGGTDEVVKDRKDEFAEFCYAYLQIMKNNGVVIDAFSIQNEPLFPQPYSSCVYTPKSYYATFKTVGSYLRSKGFSTRMIATEDIGDLGRYLQFLRPITSDPVTNGFADIAAIHSYAADAKSAGSNEAALWRDLGIGSRMKNPTRAFWQTETSGYANDYKGAISLSVSIYTALKFGKVNAWMFHGLSHPTEVEGLVLKSGKTDRYFAAKHFFKYVRPGSISVDASPTEEAILATAFQNNAKKTLSIVLINVDSANSRKVKLKTIQTSGVPSTYKMFVTTNSNTRCVDRGTINSGAEITMPANSIVTLVGENSSEEMPLEVVNEEQASINLAAVPNPSSNGFLLKSNQIIPRQLEVFTPQGVLVQKLNLTNDASEHFIPTGHLTPGLYVLKCKNSFLKILLQ